MVFSLFPQKFLRFLFFIYIYFPNKVFLTGMYGFRIEIHKRSEWVSWIFTKLFIFITNKCKRKFIESILPKFSLFCVFLKKKYFSLPLFFYWTFFFFVSHIFLLFEKQKKSPSFKLFLKNKNPIEVIIYFPSYTYIGISCLVNKI